MIGKRPNEEQIEMGFPLQRQIHLASVFIIAFLGITFVAFAETPKVPLPTVTSIPVEFGPFQIDDRSLIVRIVTDKASSVLPLAWSETVSRYEVRDLSGKILFVENYHSEIKTHGFDEMLTMEAYKLQGKAGEAIILFKDISPSAPASGRSFRVLGWRDNVIASFSDWLTVYGLITPLPKTEGSALSLLQGNVIEMSVWTGAFGIVVPVTLDFLHGTLSIPEGTRVYGVDTGEPYFYEEPGKARLFSGPSADTGITTVQVTRESKIEYLDARASVRLKRWEGREENMIELVVEEVPWLRIRIDDKEGWVRDVDDLYSVGLRQAG